MKQVFVTMFTFLMMIQTTSSYAVCIDNQTEFTLHYVIQNKNMGCSQPKIKHYSGDLTAKSKRCFAHTREEGRDWQIYRKDVIDITPLPGSTLVCHKKVNGILNTLQVTYHDWNSRWWCLDDSDYED